MQILRPQCMICWIRNWVSLLPEALQVILLLLCWVTGDCYRNCCGGRRAAQSMLESQVQLCRNATEAFSRFWALHPECHGWGERWQVHWQWHLHFPLLLPWVLMCLSHWIKKSGQRNGRRGRRKARHRWEITVFNHRNCYCKGLGHNARNIALKGKVARESSLSLFFFNYSNLKGRERNETGG